MVIVLSARFKDELKKIFDFIAQDDYKRAEFFYNEILDKIKILSSFPLIGRAISHSEREFIYKSYVMPYVIKDDIILILGIYKSNQWKLG